MIRNFKILENPCLLAFQSSSKSISKWTWNGEQLMGYSLFTFLGNKGSIHIELAHHLKLFVWIGQSWEKGKEKERREVIFLVWLDERREKWVDLEWLNFHEVKGRGIFGLFYNFYYKITNLPFYSSYKSYLHGYKCKNKYFPFHSLWKPNKGKNLFSFFSFLHPNTQRKTFSFFLFLPLVVSFIFLPRCHQT